MTERSAWPDNSADQEAHGLAVRLSRLYLDALRADDSPSAYRIASGALQEGMKTPELCQRVIAPAMHEVGRLWEQGALTVADEHLATALTHRVLAALRPHPSADRDTAAETLPRGRVMLAAVEGEQHALGLRMAADILEDSGFHTIYLGADVPTEALLQAVSSLAPDRLVLSATMPELAPRLAEVSDSLSKAHPQVELLVGGQAASSRLVEGTLVQDLEALPRVAAS